MDFLNVPGFKLYYKFVFYVCFFYRLFNVEAKNSEVNRM